jgi:hypothetical protein
VTRAAGEEDFVTAVFAELDPRGWIQLVICGHPPPLHATGRASSSAWTSRSTRCGRQPSLQAAADELLGRL